MARRFSGTGITKRELFPIDPATWGDDWNAAVKEGGGIFGATSLPALRLCEALLEATPRTDDGYAVDSPESFAQYIAKCIRMAKISIGEGSADQAAVHAWRAGVEWARATMKWQWEADALRGEKVATAAGDGADKTNARHRVQREKRMARMAELVRERGSVDSAAAECEVLGLGSRGAIKRQWYRRTRKV